MKKTIIIIAAVSAVVAVLVLFGSPRRPFDWSFPDRSKEKMGQPYGTDVIDSLLSRSLPNGYESVVIPTYTDDRTGDDYDYYGDLRPPFIPLDRVHTPDPGKSTMVVMSSPWKATVTGSHYYDYEDIEVLKDLLDYTRRGHEIFFATVRNDIELMDPVEQAFKVPIVTLTESDDAYTPNWHKRIGSEKVKLVDLRGQKVMEIDRMFTPARFYLGRMRNYSEKSGMYMRPLLVDSAKPYEAYALEITCPKTGGRLTVTTLGVYFMNLGVSIPEGTDVMDYFMDRIDHKPVERVDYEKRNYPIFRYEEEESDEDSSHPLSVISRNPALSLAWTLLVLTGVFILLNGLMRLYPAISGAKREEVDMTDAVAAREYKLRKSPLLHFLYQTSGLHRRSDNYESIFMINYRRFARMVARITGIRLAAADEQQLHAMADVLAARSSRPAAEVLEEMRWMLETSAMPEVDVNSYIRSQRIVESYNL